MPSAFPSPSAPQPGCLCSASLQLAPNAALARLPLPRMTSAATVLPPRSPLPATAKPHTEFTSCPVGYEGAHLARGTAQPPVRPVQMGTPARGGGGCPHHHHGACHPCGWLWGHQREAGVLGCRHHPQLTSLAPGTTGAAPMPRGGTDTVGRGEGWWPRHLPNAAVPHGACVPPRRSLPACHICASWFLALARLKWQLADGRGCQATVCHTAWGQGTRGKGLDWASSGVP